jgi:hypothetical protein
VEPGIHKRLLAEAQSDIKVEVKQWHI